MTKHPRDVCGWPGRGKSERSTVTGGGRLGDHSRGDNKSRFGKKSCFTLKDHNHYIDLDLGGVGLNTQVGRDRGSVLCIHLKGDECLRVTKEQEILIPIATSWSLRVVRVFDPLHLLQVW